jgi:hypothetical protein
MATNGHGYQASNCKYIFYPEINKKTRFVVSSQGAAEVYTSFRRLVTWISVIIINAAL